MAETYEERKQRLTQETLDWHGITEWYKQGYKGKGINSLELEDSEHGENVNEIDSIVAPESKNFLHGYRCRCKGDTCLYFEVGVDGEYIDLAKFVKDNNIHIIGLSTSGSLAEPAERYLKSLNVIYFASAGNDGSEGVTATLENIAINVGSIKLDGDLIKKECYSSCNEDTLDFVTLHMHRRGTSFSQPVLRGISKLILSRYGLMSQEDLYSILVSLAFKNPGACKYDTMYGWGAPRLPKEGIENLKEETMIEFKHNPVDDPKVNYVFGYSEAYYNKTKHHNGIDLAANTVGVSGDNIYSVDDGVVAFIRLDSPSGGKYIIIEHDGYCTGYYHNIDILPEVGEKVAAGQVIAFMGSTGQSTGPHLHFEVREGKYGANYWDKEGTKYVNAVDPEPYLLPVEEIEEEIKTDEVSDWAVESWEKAVKKGINDGVGPKNNITEEQLMVFFDRLGLLD